MYYSHYEGLESRVRPRYNTGRQGWRFSMFYMPSYASQAACGGGFRGNRLHHERGS